MADSEMLTMPPVILPDESEEERKRKLIASAGGMSAMPPVRSAANATATIPRGFSDAAISAARGNGRPRSDLPLTDAERGLALRTPSVTGTMPPVTPAPLSPGEEAARTHPTMPPVKALTPPAAPDLGAPGMMPPVRLGPTSEPAPPSSIPAATPTAMPPVTGKAEMAAPSPSVQPGVMPPVRVGPEMQRYQDLAAKGAPNPKWWQRALEIAGSLSPFGRLIEEQIPSTPLGYNAKLNQAALRAAKEQLLGKGAQEAETAASQARFNTPEKREAYMRQHPEQFEDMSTFEKNDWRVTGKFPQRETTPKTERPENLDREAYDYYVGQGMSPADARKRVLQDAQDVKPERQTHTSPFDAIEYGSPEEKKAAQDYLEFQEKLRARYRTPSEFNEKYRLFKEDPETYKAMFGDKAGTPDRATATRMLNYFEKRRREVNGDFMLDDTQKQEQLRDIENLEKPFMDAVQPGAGGDRVNVIGPDGTPGTIPRSQLEKAKKKGYREAQ